MAKTFLEVNGLRVVAQDTASDRIYGGNSSVRKITTVLELLLEDDSTVFGCNYNAPHAKNCEYTAASVRSVVAHQRSHSRKLREQKIYRNRVNGANKAAETKRVKAGKTVRIDTTSPAVTGNVKPSSTQLLATAGHMTADQIAKGLIGFAAELRDVATEIDRLVRNLPATPAKPLIDANELDRLQEIERNYNALKDLLK